MVYIHISKIKHDNYTHVFLSIIKSNMCFMVVRTNILVLNTSSGSSQEAGQVHAGPDPAVWRALRGLHRSAGQRQRRSVTGETLL